MKRSGQVDHLGAGEVFDGLISGGGATGLGAAVDAAAWGIRGRWGSAKLRGREPNQRRVRAAADNGGSHHASN